MDTKTPNNRQADIVLQAWITEMRDLKETIIEDRKHHNENIHELTKIFRTAFEKISGIELTVKEHMKCFHLLDKKVEKHDTIIKILIFVLSPTTILSLISTILLILLK